MLERLIEIYKFWFSAVGMLILFLFYGVLCVFVLAFFLFYFDLVGIVLTLIFIFVTMPMLFFIVECFE
jgi:hypothetical protein